VFDVQYSSVATTIICNVHSARSSITPTASIEPETYAAFTLYDMTARNETWRLWKGFPSFKTQISCLQFQAGFVLSL